MSVEKYTKSLLDNYKMFDTVILTYLLHYAVQNYCS